MPVIGCRLLLTVTKALPALLFVVPVTHIPVGNNVKW